MEKEGVPDVLTWVGVDAIGKYSFCSGLPIGLGEAGVRSPQWGRDARHGWCSDAWRVLPPGFRGDEWGGGETRQNKGNEGRPMDLHPLAPRAWAQTWTSHQLSPICESSLRLSPYV